MSRWSDPDLDATIYVDLCTPDDPDDYPDDYPEEVVDDAADETP